MNRKRIVFSVLIPGLLMVFMVSLLGIWSIRPTQTQAAMHKKHSIPYHLGLHSLDQGTSQVQSSLKSAGLPTWSSSFSYQGISYPYTMVGTNPASGSHSSIIPVDIIPLIFTFSTGTTLNGNAGVKKITDSALFHRAHFTTGHTQYLDAMQRGAFWSAISAKSPEYHLLLGKPTVKSAVTIKVPAHSGYSAPDAEGNKIGYVDVNWFSSISDNLTVKNSAPDHLVIFAAINVYQYNGDPGQCCIGGYHSAVQKNNSIYTYVYASYDQSGDVFQNIDALTHEVAEWGSDPYVNNMTPNWYATNYGCSNLLEVGDPSVGTDFVINRLNYQDEVYFSWFSHDIPSKGYHQQYDYLGRLYRSPAVGC